MSILSRVRGRYRRMHAHDCELRVPFLLAPVHRRSPRLLRRRLRRLGAPNARQLVAEVDGLRAALARAEAEYALRAPDFDAGSLNPLEGALLYGLVRTLRPRAVVETGTANGISTAYLLAALHHNGGRLVSVDLPFAAGDAGELRPIVPGTTIDVYDASPVPNGKEPGWMIPDELRGRWELRLGDARELLPSLLAELGEIELFFHDSLHTREHMLFEFETAWPHLASGGVLVSDDIFQRKHDALPVFAQQVGRTFSTFGNLGIIRK